MKQLCLILSMIAIYLGKSLTHNTTYTDFTYLAKKYEKCDEWIGTWCKNRYENLAPFNGSDYFRISDLVRIFCRTQFSGSKTTAEFVCV